MEPSRPFGDDYGDGRDADQLAAARPHVRTQVEHLVRLGRDPDYLDRFVQRLNERRSGTGAPQLETVRRDDGTATFVAAGRLLAPRAAAHGLRRDDAAPLGLTSVEPDPGGALVRLHVDPRRRSADRAMSTPQLRAEARRLGVETDFDTVVVLGVVMKAEGGPEPAPPGPAFPAVAVPDGAGPVVAVIDTGISMEQRTDGYLQNLLRPDNLDPLDALPVPGDGLLDAAAGHGAFVTGVIQQVAPGAQVRVYRVTDSDGIATDGDVAAVLRRAVAEGARIVNLSLGASSPDDTPPPAMTQAIRELSAANPDVLFVAAAGNDGPSGARVWPAALAATDPSVVAVAGLAARVSATEPPGPNDWSGRGDWVTCSTVGQGVVSTYVIGTEDGALIGDDTPDTYGPDSWATWTGTSFAAPQISGGVARILQEKGGTAADALAELLAGAPSDLPGWGKRVEILPGTPTG